MMPTDSDEAMYKSKFPNLAEEVNDLYKGKFKIEWDLHGGNDIAFYKMWAAEPIWNEAIEHMERRSPLAGEILLEAENALTEVRTHCLDNTPDTELHKYAMLVVIHDFYKADLDDSASDYVMDLANQMDGIAGLLDYAPGFETRSTMIDMLFDGAKAIAPFGTVTQPVDTRYKAISSMGSALDAIANHDQRYKILEKKYGERLIESRAEMQKYMEPLIKDVRTHILSKPTEKDQLIEDLKWHKRV